MTDWLDDCENDLIDPQDGDVPIRVLDGVTKDECAQIIKIAYERGKRAGKREGSQPVAASDEERARWDAWYDERRRQERRALQRMQRAEEMLTQAIRFWGPEHAKITERAMASLGSPEPLTDPTPGDAVDQAEWAMEGLRRFVERMTRSLGGLERAVASPDSPEPSGPTPGDSEGSG